MLAAAQPTLPCWQHTDLCRKTVTKGLAELEASGWGLAAARKPQAPRIVLPSDLLTDRQVGVQGRLLYGYLQLLPAFTRPRGHFTYQQLSEATALCQPTLSRAVRELVRVGWLEIAQEHRRAPILFLLCDPVLDKGVAEMEIVRQRLDGLKYLGEAIMREYLTLLVATTHFLDNATPEFLVNPMSDAHLQLDRFYPDKVAFEYNGPQHYHATAQYSEETVTRQRIRDLIKTGICAKEGITLVVIHAEDLTLDTMCKKIPALLPRRDLKGHEPLIAFLKDESRRCRRLGKHHRRPME